MRERLPLRGRDATGEAKGERIQDESASKGELGSNVRVSQRWTDMGTNACIGRDSSDYAENSQIVNGESGLQ